MAILLLENNPTTFTQLNYIVPNLLKYYKYFIQHIHILNIGLYCLGQNYSHGM